MFALIAGSRAGKGRSVIIPNLLHWQGSAIVYDPAGENYAVTAKYRREVLGQKTILLDPFGVTGQKSDTWNPLSEIDFDRDPLVIDKCNMLAESLHFDVSPDPFWTQAPRKMLSTVIAYVGARSIEENLHLPTVRDLLNDVRSRRLVAGHEQMRGLWRHGEALWGEQSEPP